MAKRRSNKLPTRGKRTGVTIDGGDEKNANQMDSIKNFFDQARSPEEKKDDDPTSKQSLAEGTASRPAVRNRKGPVRKAQEKIRVSLPGQASDGDDASTSTDSSENNINNGKQKFVNKKSAPRMIVGVPSPSEISRVSTLPPTPGTELRHELLSPQSTPAPRLPSSSGERGSAVRDLEVARRAEARESEERPVLTDEPEADEFDVAPENDDDDGDALLPPVMDDEEELLPAPTTQPENEDDSKPAAKAAMTDLSDTDDDDDDNAGSGFAMAQDAETPGAEQDVRRPVEDEEEEEEEQPAHEKKKKKEKRRGSMESDDKTPAHISKKKKKYKRVGFSPQGIPIANRDYQRIPVVEPSPDDAGALRRSRRAKTTPLEFWKNERVEYGPPDDDLAEEIGDMPIPTHVVKALPTPYRKRKDPQKSKTATKKNGKSKEKKRSRQVEEDNDEDDHSFDPTLLKRKYKENLLEGETANVWDDGNDDLNDLKVVSYAVRMEAADLPLLSTRTKEEGNIVGSAAQAFNVPSDANDNYVGYIMGNLLLPPRGIKDAESVGPCSQTFTVCTGQKRALEVAFADPDGPEGMLDDNTAQRFLLGPGDLFRVPPGNTYRLENHSSTKPCLLTWTIIRPRNIQTVPSNTTTTTPPATTGQESP